MKIAALERLAGQPETLLGVAILAGVVLGTGGVRLPLPALSFGAKKAPAPSSSTSPAAGAPAGAQLGPAGSVPPIATAIAYGD